MPTSTATAKTESKHRFFSAWMGPAWAAWTALMLFGVAYDIPRQLTGLGSLLQHTHTFLFAATAVFLILLLPVWLRPPCNRKAAAAQLFLCLPLFAGPLALCLAIGNRVEPGNTQTIFSCSLILAAFLGFCVTAYQSVPRWYGLIVTLPALGAPFASFLLNEFALSRTGQEDSLRLLHLPSVFSAIQNVGSITATNTKPFWAMTAILLTALTCAFLLIGPRRTTT